MIGEIAPEDKRGFLNLSLQRCEGRVNYPTHARPHTTPTRGKEVMQPIAALHSTCTSPGDPLRGEGLCPRNTPVELCFPIKQLWYPTPNVELIL